MPEHAASWPRRATASAGPVSLPNVEVLRWPAQEDRRHLLAALGEPRVLLLAPHTQPPAEIDDLEHWIPEGADPAAIVRGVNRLQREVLHGDGPPNLDADGLVWFRGRWVAVADSQVPLVDLLVRNYQRLVRHDELRAADRANGGGRTTAARRAVMHRVGARLALVGLKLHVVHRRGFVLTEDSTAHTQTGAGVRPGLGSPVP